VPFDETGWTEGEVVTLLEARLEFRDQLAFEFNAH